MSYHMLAKYTVVALPSRFVKELTGTKCVKKAICTPISLDIVTMSFRQFLCMLTNYNAVQRCWHKKAKFAHLAKITARISHLAVDGKGGRVKFSKRFSDQLSRQIRQF